MRRAFRLSCYHVIVTVCKIQIFWLVGIFTLIINANILYGNVFYNFASGTHSRWLQKWTDVLPALKNVQRNSQWVNDLANYKVRKVVQRGGNLAPMIMNEVLGSHVATFPVTNGDKLVEITTLVRSSVALIQSQFDIKGAAIGVIEFQTSSVTGIDVAKHIDTRPESDEEKLKTISKNMQIQVVLVLAVGEDIVSEIIEKLNLPAYAKRDPEAMFDAHNVSGKSYKNGYRAADGYGIFVHTKYKTCKELLNAEEWVAEIKEIILKLIKPVHTKLGIYVKRPSLSSYSLSKPYETIFVVFKGRGYGKITKKKENVKLKGDQSKS